MKRLEGVVGIRLQRSVSITPAGDLITLLVTNRGMPELVELLDTRAIGADTSSVRTSSQPSSIISPPHNDDVASDISESNWKEMETTIGDESNVSANTLGQRWALLPERFT